MSSKSQSKKQKVLAAQKKARAMKLIIPAMVTIAVVIIMVLIFGNVGGSGSSAIPQTQEQSASNGDVVALNIADFSDGTAKYYEVDVADKKVRFFVLKSSDGVIRSAFDACDVCYAAKKGYRQAGDIMVCNNCGQQFPSHLINVEKGGCNPSPLDRTIDGESVIITLQDISKGAVFF